MKNFDRKALIFNQSIRNAYIEEEQRPDYGKLDLNEDELTEDFTAMLYGLYIFYKELIDENCDLIDFIGILNRLAVQKIVEDSEEKSNEETN